MTKECGNCKALEPDVTAYNITYSCSLGYKTNSINHKDIIRPLEKCPKPLSTRQFHKELVKKETSQIN